MTDSPWIEWSGGECPVPAHTIVELKFLEAPAERPMEAHFYDWNWIEGGHFSDIIAYRIVNPEPQP